MPVHFAFRSRIGGALCVAVLCWAAGGGSAWAVPSPDQPVLVEADSFGYDTRNALVVAEGNAEVVQGGYIVLADRITYDQNTGIVRASGNVAVAEPDGNVFFAEEAELQNEVRTGVISNFRARLTGDALFVAREARKVDANVTEMDYAVYSACKVCEGSAPMWQLKAQKIRYDEEAQSISYNHARMELFGVPVLYTPYFSHAAPDADRKSGFLMPSYEYNGNLGAVVSAPYYWNIAPQMDAVITPIYTSDQGPVIAGEFRHLLPSGSYSLGGSFTRPDDIDSQGRPAGGKDWRGHIEGEGRFRISDVWHWGFNGKRASDDTYLRRYDFSYEDLLTSTAYVQGYTGRSFANIEAVTFQGLRQTDNADTMPLIHPWVDAGHETEPGWMGSRFGVSGNLMALSRDLGSDSRRISSTAYWRLPMVSAGGHVMELRPQLRADMYSVSDSVTANGQPFDGTKGRAIPELHFNWKYPVIRRFASSSLILEPTAQVVLGVNGIDSDGIPNDDSLALEFSDSNLFMANHYPGYDLVESGTRINYGIRGQWDYDSGGRVLFLFGQNYHTDRDNLFPYSDDLDQELSDYVGRVAWAYSDNVEFGYRFRLDRKDAEIKRSEIESQFNIDPLRLNLNYVRIERDTYLDDSEEIRAASRLRLNRNWAWTALARNDLSDNGGLIQAGTGLQYQNECVTIATGVNRRYIRDRDVEPNTSFTLQVFLKNLN